MTTTIQPLPAEFKLAVESIRRKLEKESASFSQELGEPKVGIVCGSGLSGLGDALEDKVIIPYEELEGFGKSTVLGHKSALAFGYLGGKAGSHGSSKRTPVVAMLGRFHPYEGHSMASVIFPIRVLALLGVKRLIITNAAGSLNPKIPTGTIVVVHDHLALPNLTGHLNPLLGPVLGPPFETRFVPLSNAYSFEMRKTTFKAAHELQFPPEYLAEGTYAWVSGPTYETAAEGRYLRAAGADVVGMSTVPEVLAAVQARVEVLVLSLVCNPVVIPDSYQSARQEVDDELAGRPLKVVAKEEVSHSEVLEVGKQRGEDMRRLVQRIVEIL
ncbi:hypothetical protein FRB93_014003 [Tulasnella sp. JGI-2019a]|nr:hypothetical protein FRB93_014003 [Tulasnella sp. JGI-2019a]